MFRLQIATAVAITVVWVGVVYAAVTNPAHPELITLATLVTPVMLLPAGWLFAAPVISQRRASAKRRSNEARDESR